MVHFKVTYWNGRGAAEVHRQLLFLAKQEFEDHRVERDNWPALKPSMPFGQVPVMEEDGKQLAQSSAIARYLARKYGFAGKNAWDEAQVDALSDQFKDFCKSFQPYIAVIFGVGEGDKEKLKEEVFLPAAKTNLPYFVRALKNSGSGYLVGDSLTYVDLMIAELTSSFFEKNAPEVLDEFPEMRKHYKKVQSHPDLKKWIETRPETVF